jgi:hypothetical protein
VKQRHRGRPVLGAVAGFFFGIFIALDLVVFGVMPLHADALAFMPLLGLVAGLFMGLKAPFARRGSKQAMSSQAATADRTPEPVGSSHG